MKHVFVVFELREDQFFQANNVTTVKVFGENDEVEAAKLTHELTENAEDGREYFMRKVPFYQKAE